MPCLLSLSPPITILWGQPLEGPCNVNTTERPPTKISPQNGGRGGGVSAPEKHQALWTEARSFHCSRWISQGSAQRLFLLGRDPWQGKRDTHGAQACLLPGPVSLCRPLCSTRMIPALQQAPNSTSGARERAKEGQRFGTQTTCLTLHSM